MLAFSLLFRNHSCLAMQLPVQYLLFSLRMVETHCYGIVIRSLQFFFLMDYPG